MTVKEFLKSEKTLNLSAIAAKMYPTNKSAKTYLTNKLNENDNRKFTKKDGQKALTVLKELAVKVTELDNPS